jgi:hypothetical protein
VSLGDDGFFGWLQTGLYFVAAWACWRRSRRVPSPRAPARARGYSEHRVWLFLAGACSALGLNKQLDLQTLAFLWLREMAGEMHDYGGKGLLRAAVLLGACGFVIVTGTYGIGLVRRASWSLRCAMAGLVLLGPFALLRLARFSRFSAVGSDGIVDVALELLPTLFVIGSAFWRPQPVTRRGRS